MSHWIRTPEELAAFALELAGAAVLGLDSESDSLYHYTEKVCLVQMATTAGARLLDTLVIRDLTPLAPVFADPGVVKVLHGADYDVVTLKRDFGVRFGALFDTMIAARFLGLPQIGLQAVVQQELGVTLGKEGQTADWSRRPLLPALEQYALSDVRHLLPLYDALSSRLRTLGRFEWVVEESAAVADLPPARRKQDPDAFLRIKGAARMQRRALAVLREVFYWRESVSQARDLPPFKVLSNETLLALAEQGPRDVQALGRIRGILPRLAREADRILAAVAAGLATPESGLPRIERSPRPVVAPEVRARIDRLKTWRTSEGQRLGLDPSLLLPQRLIDLVAERGPQHLGELESLDGLRRWRLENFGAGLLKAVSGA